MYWSTSYSSVELVFSPALAQGSQCHTALLVLAVHHPSLVNNQAWEDLSLQVCSCRKEDLQIHSNVCIYWVQVLYGLIHVNLCSFKNREHFTWLLCRIVYTNSLLLFTQIVYYVCLLNCMSIMSSEAVIYFSTVNSGLSLPPPPFCCFIKVWLSNIRLCSSCQMSIPII